MGAQVPYECYSIFPSTRDVPPLDRELTVVGSPSSQTLLQAWRDARKMQKA